MLLAPDPTTDLLPYLPVAVYVTFPVLYTVTLHSFPRYSKSEDTPGKFGSIFMPDILIKQRHQVPYVPGFTAPLEPPLWPSRRRCARMRRPAFAKSDRLEAYRSSVSQALISLLRSDSLSIADLYQDSHGHPCCWAAKCWKSAFSSSNRGLAEIVALIH